jgi:hypothetical protein
MPSNANEARTTVSEEGAQPAALLQASGQETFVPLPVYTQGELKMVDGTPHWGCPKCAFLRSSPSTLCTC